MEQQDKDPQVRVLKKEIRLDVIFSSLWQHWRNEKIKDNGVVDTESVNLLSVKYLAKLLVYYFVLWKYDILQKRTPYLAFWMKAYACSLLSYAVLSFIPTFAFRISEVLGVVEVAIIPFLIYTVRPQAVGRAFVSVYCLALLLYNVFINELFTLNLS